MLIHVSDRCTRCGRCQAVCPTAIIRMTEGRPFVEETDEGRCIVCGHCVAICPHAALDHRLAPLREQSKLKKNPAVGPRKTRNLLRSVRSIRVYKKDEIDRKTIVRIVDTARFVPTGANSQGVTFLAVMESQSVRELARHTLEWLKKQIDAGSEWAQPYKEMVSGKVLQRDPIFRGAPHVLIALANTSIPFSTDNARMAMVYARIQAASLNVGSCWAGFFELYARAQPQEVAALLHLSEHNIVGAAIMLGYAKYAYHRLPDRDPLKLEFI